MNHVLRVTALGCGALLLALTGIALSHQEGVMRLTRDWQERADGLELADRLLSSRAVVDYISAHPDQVSLAVWTIGAEQDGIYLNADARRPIAGLQKLLLLAEYAQRVAAGVWSAEERVPIADWERHWLPGTDGAAHAAALHLARAEGCVRDDAVSMNDVVRAMVRHDDDAAEDWLIERIGRASVSSLPARLGLVAREQAGLLDAAPLPVAGTAQLWRSAPTAELLARYRALGLDRYADDAYRLAERPREARAGSSALSETPSLRDQSLLARALGPFGNARTYAELMQRIVSGTLAADGVMREQLEWTMASAALQGEFERLAREGGGSPGTLTAASYGQAKGARAPRVLAVMWSDLPPAVWLHLSGSSVQSRFERDLLQDDAFFAETRERLAGSTAASPAARLDARAASSR